ncbi:hypothetical protein PFISCL1PPCAC_23269, partial [Pristionchus fissidentatus]
MILQVGNLTGAVGGVNLTNAIGLGTTTLPPSRCAPYTAPDGVVYANRCATKDLAAVCNAESWKTHCTCSARWTDTYCSVSLQSLDNLGGNSSGQLIDVINSGSPARLITSLPALLSFLTDEQRVELSYTVDEMILEATYEEKPLDIHKHFTLFNDPSLGNCFTFNHFNASTTFQARGHSARYGLRVTLDFQAHEYAPWVESVGMYTYVHAIGQDIYLESVKHNVHPGRIDQVAMKKYRFTRMRNMFSHCAETKAVAQSYYFAGNYSVDGCLRSCYQDSVYRACGCMDPSYARKQGIKACNFEQLSCIDSMAARRGDAYYWPECTCSLPCGDEHYEYETSRAQLIQLSRVLGLTGGFVGILLGASIVFIVEVGLLVVRVGMIIMGNPQMLNAMKMKRVQRKH